ncbi:MAG: hypothetical protein QOI44_2546 [Actinomycetota bacterium]|jgi:hypothetical protein|nr:hypothetical protein [Actinomycetota bacterium]
MAINVLAVSVDGSDIEQGDSRWRTFADPEGNEFDLVAG